MPKRSMTLQKVLTLPFILLMSLSVLITSYLTWQFNKKTTSLLAKQISKQSAYRIEERLEHYLSRAQTFNESLKAPINYHLLEVDNRERLLEYITYVTLRNPDIATLSYAYPDGSYMGISNTAEGHLLKKMASPASNRMFSTYDLTTNKVIQQKPDYDARRRPWFIEARALNQPVWSSIFEMYSSGKLGVTYAEALYDEQKNFIGVVGTDVVFEDLDEQLSNIRLTNNSYLFILDDKGNVIAQSDLDEEHGASNLYQFHQSSNPLLTQAVNFIHTQADFDTKPIHNDTDFVINGKSASYSVNSIPYVHSNGLHWYIGVVIPETDFLGQVNEVRKNTFFIWLVSFCLSILLGLLITYLISREINGLRTKVRDIERTGGMYEHDNGYAIKEVEDLSRVFSVMSRRLYESYLNMKHSNELLQDTSGTNSCGFNDTNPPIKNPLNNDKLTALDNRRSFDCFLQFYWSHFAAAGSKDDSDLSLVMCDLSFAAQTDANHDNLQQYPQMTDEKALQQFVEVIGRCTRKTDIAARYDNDKIAIILPHTTADEAVILAQRIIKELVQQRISYQQETPDNNHYLSVTLGIASTSQREVSDKYELINRAIVALATAKEEGKESFVIYQS